MDPGLTPAVTQPWKANVRFESMPPDAFAAFEQDLLNDVIPAIESTQLALVLKEPMGCVACIVPSERTQTW